MTYKLIQECELEVFKRGYAPDLKQSDYDGRVDFVSASALETFLAKGVRVYEQYEKPSANYWSAEQSSKDTHQALLINIREIPKPEPVSKEELLKFIKDKTHRFESDALSFIERIEKAGIK